jgi:hypothetical protein
MNYKIKEIHVVFFAFIVLIIANFMQQNYSENFATNFDINPKNYNNYWFDWNYWLYYINPWYPPFRVDLPFGTINGTPYWYSPYDRI